ncbi:MAG: type II/IV secretion system ATPase subunit [Candidatus Bathyarchaeota archaeon]|nr:type II/IV secretion system ATPase subunit [Candidatus Bathyarchaeota archaeon]MDH5531860.1 type II/IV secretion system ATPase subunit [Candidatus Bathyarchaeota archaeon]MDH5712356.1 type II/IV secretion system ATPase subunit [Candidatus Bathyarchaeota archaeon]
MLHIKRTTAKLRKKLKAVKKLKFWGKRKEEVIPPAPPIPIPRGYRTVERTALYEPFAHAVIVQNPATGEFKYILDELQLDPFEQGIYDRILEILLAEIRSPKEEIKDPRVFFDTEAKKIIEKYRISLGWLADVSWSKILYHAERDLVGFGQIDALMRDANIEDISCDGVGKPVYVWHRKYENLESNLFFREDEELDNLMVKLVHMAGKHVSSAFPIVDASLPGKHRLAVCYRREVTPFGTTFTIRKFREDPYSIIDLINLGTLSEEIAAYFWVGLENRASIMVLGGTAAGKTTALNALACLIKPGSKLLTIEETAELNLPHENWVSFISRRSYGLGENQAGEVSLFDLVKASMRHRPDYLIVGEVRGSEAYVLFQALATGHGGMCTMHAESLNSAVRRLTQKPMDIAPAYIPLMNLVGIIRRVHLPKAGEMKAYRRITSVDEIADYEKYQKVFEWEPASDNFSSSLSRSLLLSDMSKRLGVSQHDLTEEMERRKNVLGWMRRRNIRSYRDVAQVITEYYSRPKEFYEKKVEPVVSAKSP